MCTCCLGSLSRRGCARVSSRLKHLPTQPPLLLVLHIAKWITSRLHCSLYNLHAYVHTYKQTDACQYVR
ncbi:hypothetical protein C0Q70_15179 [Pomacea canaliculata]|uniref:Uncharacterized protein n=1 Tax=Pomacea canaliculata TaxID=400727 RepID=A0A2T7NU59_POMCA|nr:hypothetical protein C0Q70_15179 [Pomacea canaliculata]